jgi:adenosylcobinamide kinase/adenosylcobinamide-phosphate guanylyltransferase
VCRILFVTGGARSGKTAQAQRLATALGQPVVYLATMDAADDEELEARISRHRADRPTDWTTVEEPLDLLAAMRPCPAEATVLLDCLSLWVSNQLLASVPHADNARVAQWEAATEGCVTAAANLVSAAATRAGGLVAVTNEVGLGVVPGDRLSRYYRDALGLVNRAFATAADEAYLMVSGLPMRLR